MFGRHFETGRRFIARCVAPTFIRRFARHVTGIMDERFGGEGPRLRTRADRLHIAVLRRSITGSNEDVDVQGAPPLVELATRSTVTRGFYSRRLLTMLVGYMGAGVGVAFYKVPNVKGARYIGFFSRFVPTGRHIVAVRSALRVHCTRAGPNGSYVRVGIDRSIFNCSRTVGSYLEVGPG